MGGLSKKAFQIETVREEKGWPWIAVDAGNLLFKSINAPQGTLDKDKIKAETLVAAYNSMGYTAVAVGPGDLIAGVGYLKELEKKSSFAWLSANLVSKKDGKPIFRDMVFQKAGDTNVAILGLTTNPMPPAELEKGYTLKPWNEVLPPLLEKATKSDMVILLSSLETMDNRAIAKANPGIHLIIQASAISATNQPPQQVEAGALLTQTEQQGKTLGVMHISWGASKKWRRQDPVATLQEKKGEMDRLNWQLDRQQSQGDPELAFANDPVRLNSYRMLRDRKQQLADEISRIEAEGTAEEKDKPSTFTSNFIGMEPNFPDQPKIRELVEEAKKRMNETEKTSVMPPVAAPTSSAPPLRTPNISAGQPAPVDTQRRRATGRQQNTPAP